jgi:peroxiredoxin
MVVVAAILGLEWLLTRDAVHGPAPPIEARLTSGEIFSTESLRGRPALVYFWAEWCGVCALQQGAIDGVLADHPGVTVALQSGSPEEVGRHLARHGLAWPTIADEAGAIARQYGVAGVPAAFVLDGTGEVRFVTRGYTTGPGLRARLGWAGLVGAGAQ